MGKQFASGKNAHGFCDRCGFRYQLTELKNLVINERLTDLRVCPVCWEPDHPQLRIGRVNMDDPQALRNPRPDTSLEESRELSE